VPDVIRSANCPVILHPTMQRASGDEELNSFTGSSQFLHAQKIPFAIATGYESYVPKTRLVRYEAAMAMVHGLGFDAALRSITIDAANLLGISDRFGSLEPAKWPTWFFMMVTHSSTRLMSSR
jgi:imidazolonepropionase-like amidohydrolase